MTFNVNPVSGIEALYSFNGLGEQRISIPVSPGPGAGTVPTDVVAVQSGTVNMVKEADRRRPAVPDDGSGPLAAGCNPSVIS